MKRVRVVLCGDVSVGKSSLIQRFSQRKFTEGLSSTLAGAFNSQYVKVDNQLVCLEIWDTAGSERYRSVIPSFFRNVSAVIIVYDVTNRDSFDSLDSWVEFSKNNGPECVPLFIIGNKIDLFNHRAVSSDEAQIFCNTNNINFCFEASAKSGEFVDDIFSHVASIPAVIVNESSNVANVIDLKKGDSCC